MLQRFIEMLSDLICLDAAVFSCSVNLSINNSPIEENKRSIACISCYGWNTNVLEAIAFFFFSPWGTISSVVVQTFWKLDFILDLNSSSQQMERKAGCHTVLVRTGGYLCLSPEEDIDAVVTVMRSASGFALKESRINPLSPMCDHSWWKVCFCRFIVSSHRNDQMWLLSRFWALSERWSFY